MTFAALLDIELVVALQPKHVLITTLNESDEQQRTGLASVPFSFVSCVLKVVGSVACSATAWRLDARPRKKFINIDERNLCASSSAHVKPLAK